MKMNQEIYQSAKSALEANGVPVSTAEKAALVVAKDDPKQPDLGRSEQDRKHIKDAMTWMNAEKISSTC
jgi:hypothetical protein